MRVLQRALRPTTGKEVDEPAAACTQGATAASRRGAELTPPSRSSTRRRLAPRRAGKARAAADDVHLRTSYTAIFKLRGTDDGEWQAESSVLK